MDNNNPDYYGSGAPQQPAPEVEQNAAPEEERPSFWQRNGATIITLAILGLIIGGAIAINERRTADEELAVENGSEIVIDDGQSENEGDVDGEQADEGIETPAPVQEQPSEQQPAIGSGTSSSAPTDTKVGHGVIMSGNTVTVTADKGDGYTHLARKAITEKLKADGGRLSDEQRVYAEDYLQKKHAPKGDPLHPGESVNFSADQVSEAITASQSLTDAQLQNLHQYSVLVNWPPI